MNNSNIRIRTTVDGGDNYIKMPIEQDFDNLEILSLKISQEDAYKRFCSDYGVVVGRVIANGGVGVPNAKVSVFIPLSEDDEDDDVISSIYPYKDIFLDKNAEGKRYNLLPNYNDTTDKCFTPVGSFPSKRQILDNDTVLEVYEKYYKYTTTTNNSGDYMLFGVPVGSHTLHMDVDLSNIGFLSQKPYDFIREGSPKEKFETSTKFKESDDLNSLPQINTGNKGILVRPFWGDTESCEIGITRADFELTTRIEPHAFFMGSIFGDDDNNSISKRCRLKKDIGKICESVTSEGTIEMIRKKENGTIEKFSVEGGRVIDENGVWATQIPLNLDYKVTNEFGELVPSEQVGVGVPTRTRARFRISMDYTGGEARRRQKASYLVPNHPDLGQVGDYTFDENTPDGFFTDMYWNNIYTVRNFIGRFQKVRNTKIRDHIGIKNVDDCGDKTSFPYNHYDGDINPLYSILCVIISIINTIIRVINIAIIGTINGIIKTLNTVLSIFKLDLPYVPCIGVSCDGKRFAPGCTGDNGFNAANSGDSVPLENNTSDGWLDCQQLQLADALNVLEYDFYNDWINGTLYFPLFKFKVKKNGETRFCDYDDNSNFDNWLIERCTNTNTGSGTLLKGDSLRLGKSGIIKYAEDENVFYYAASSKGSGNRPVLMTDISNLGSINDKVKLPNVKTATMINSLADTTYQLPELSDEPFDGSTALEFKGVDNFLLNVNCAGIFTNKTWCKNTKRICELGILNGEAVGVPSDGTDFIAANGVINNNDIEAISPRAKFIYNNNPFVSSPFESGYLDTSASPNAIAIFEDSDYDTFRGFTDLNSEINIPLNNSLFFYFGIVPGKSALQKFNIKYNLPCETTEVSDFIITVTNLVNNTIIGDNIGLIEIEVIGGSGDYTYEWFNEAGVLIPSTTNTITSLTAGVYSVTVTDIVSGNVLTREITVSEPLSLASSDILVINPVPFDSDSGTGGANSGEIIVNPLGGNLDPAGVGPNYTMELLDNSGSVLETVASNDGTTFTGVTFGDYKVRITDFGGTSELFDVTIIEPPEVKIFVNPTVDSDGASISPDTYNTSCGEDNGVITISVSGGTTPYSNIEIKEVPSGTLLTGSFFSNSVPAGTYEITVYDGFNVASNTETVVIADSNALVIDSVTSTLVSGSTYTITTNINPTSNGTGPLKYSLFEEGNDTPLFDGITSNNFLGTFSGTYKVLVEDTVGCIVEENITI